MTNSRAAQTRQAGTPGPEGSVAKLAYAEENKRSTTSAWTCWAPTPCCSLGYPMVRPTSWA